MADDGEFDDLYGRESEGVLVFFADVQRKRP
jgi:hypothetical protein